MERPEEIIEKYLTNKLSQAEISEFNQLLDADIKLKEQTSFQSSIVEGIREARKLELKSMLNKVSIEPPYNRFGAAKIAASVLLLSASIALFYWLNNKKETIKVAPIINPTIVERQPEATKNQSSESVIEKQNSKEGNSSSSTSIKSIPSAPVESKTTPVAENARKPIKLVDPSNETDAETNSSSSENPSNYRKGSSSNNTVLVETESFSKKYKFHYKFHKGKLVLYGSFDKSLYEILEINGEKRSVFLYYKGLYYLLDENQTTVKLLEPIQDKVLVEKLASYRQSKK